MPKPTPEQLERINRFSLTPLTEDDVYVFRDLMIDDLPVESFGIIVHRNLLRKFAADAMRGVGLLLNHDRSSLPVGRSFYAEIKEEYDEESQRFITSLYGDFYIDLGRNTESGMTTDDIVKGIESGTIFDTSIGFSANRWECSICGNDIRDFQNCSHYPGMSYEIERDGVKVTEVCYAIAGADGDGELLENSLVYAGACDRASIQKNLSFGDSVKQSGERANLYPVENIKNIPLNATIYQYYAKDGIVLFTDSPERTGGIEVEVNEKRSEESLTLEQVQEVLSKYGIEGVEQLDKELEKLDLGKFVPASQYEELSEELSKIKEQLAEKEETIKGLMAEKEELSKKAELAETYRQDLIQQTIENGIRAYGNLFSIELYTKFLNTLSIDEIKEVNKEFRSQFESRFDGVRVSKPNGETERFNAGGEPTSAEDFETEEEFRAFVAEKAEEYAKENGVSLSEATKIVYKKYKNGSEK